MSMFTKILQVSCLISGLLACTSRSRERSQQIPPQKLPTSYTPMELIASMSHFTGIVLFYKRSTTNLDTLLNSSSQ